MILENSGYLWLLLIIPCYISYSLIARKQASECLYRFAHVRKRPAPFLVSTLFLSLSLGAVIFSLAGPNVQYDKTLFNRSGIDIAIGIDVSKSMLAEDETLPGEGKKLFDIPNRLNRARYFALNIVAALRGERVGVFMFASKGVSIIPLTTDYGYCRYILKHFNEATIAIPGSDLNQAIATGVTMFEASARNAVKSIILISDGEDISDDKSRIFEAAQRAASRGVAIYTVGAGMGRGSLIPIRNSGSGIEGYYQDEDGSYLKTRLEQDTLKSIADIAGGRYFRARDEGSEESAVDAIIRRARSVEYARVTEPAWFHLAPLLLCAAFVFLAAGIISGR